MDNDAPAPDPGPRPAPDALPQPAVPPPPGPWRRAAPWLLAAVGLAEVFVAFRLTQRVVDPAPAGWAPPAHELDLMNDIHLAAGERPADVVRLVEEGQLDFGKDGLYEEREFDALQALAQLGRGNEFLKRREEFAREFPQSKWRAKAERLVLK
jgi:hypothetical protein